MTPDNAARTPARAERRPSRVPDVERRPAFTRGLAIGVDIGGTRVKAGVVTPDGEVLERVERATPTHSPEATEDAIVDIVADLRSRHRVRSVGVGAAGFVDETRSTVLFAPHLAWRREPLRARLVERTRLRVVVENDANAAAWAEYRYGAARGEESVVMVTLGTGIGGGIVRDGLLERGRHGMAGEFGHMTLVPDGRRCQCGDRGCWEQYAGGSALASAAREFAATGTPLAGALVDAVDGDVALLNGRVVAHCAEAGDPASADLIRDVGTWLGIGLANLAAALDPSILVVGGGVSAAGELLMGPARSTFTHSLTGRGFRPEPLVVVAQLGNDAGFIGAADLARTSPRRAEVRAAALRRRRSAAPARADRAELRHRGHRTR